MIKHTLFFRFKPEATEAERKALLAEYQGFPKVFPWMRNFSIGRNISERDSSFEYAFSIEFDNREDLDRYLLSEEHERHVVERFRPLVAARAIVSFVPDEL
ncbi:Dabb family protein [Alcaligenaceae bacterium]|nr:Dabb family protein [Alcaligenaceae bacterium]